MVPWFDPQYDPLHLCIFPPQYTFAELSAGFDMLDAYYERLHRSRPSARVAILIDVSQVQSSDARNRRRLGETFLRLSDMLLQHGVGQAFVVRNAIARHSITAVFWIKRPGWPIKTFARHEDALAWLAERFAEEGIQQPHVTPWWTPVEEGAAGEL